MEEGVTSTDLIAFQEQRVHETEKKNRGKNNFERISGDDGERGDYKLEEDLGGGSGGGGGGGSGGGGIINDVISNLLQQSTEAKQGEEDKGNQREEKLNDVETEEEGGGVSGGGGGGGGGGIIQTLVSHLPKNLLDDIDPPPDEASILIHSVVHD